MTDSIITTMVILPITLAGLGVLMRFFVNQITGAIDRLTNDVEEVRREVAQIRTDLSVIAHDLGNVHSQVERIDELQRQHERRLTALERAEE